MNGSATFSKPQEAEKVGPEQSPDSGSADFQCVTLSHATHKARFGKLSILAVGQHYDAGKDHR